MSEWNGSEPISVTMFGEFTVKTGGRVLTDRFGRAKRIRNLLEYLIANRNGDSSQEKLIEVLWGDTECRDPANALKNLVYRLRNLMGTPDGMDYIIFRHNTYAWNNELPCVVDIEEFKKAWEQGRRAEGESEKLKAFYRAAELYQGEFLPGSSMQDWVVRMSTGFAGMFLEGVNEICRIYAAREEYEKIVEICQRAMKTNPYAESLHEKMIWAYLRSGDRQRAVFQYEYSSGFFYDKLGVKLSDRIGSAVYKTARSLKGLETDMVVIKKDLRESDEVNGAYFCDYEQFRSAYHVMARICGRTGASVFLALLTVAPSGKKSPDNQKVSEAMQTLKGAIVSSLRKSDLVARFSSTQFILMMPSLTYENGKMVLERILRKYDQTGNIRGITVFTRLNPLETV
ncbi:MAG TPA: BTAD domain-containing putative transcriptional regulator [Clostridia bacterium]|nr:BTAD domain-containing putative transcriptional regulator [Clostridia bacterium]